MPEENPRPPPTLPPPTLPSTNLTREQQVRFYNYLKDLLNRGNIIQNVRDDRQLLLFVAVKIGDLELVREAIEVYGADANRGITLNNARLLALL